MPFTIQGNTIYSSGGAIVVQLNPSSTDLVIDENGGCIGSNMNEGQVCLVINNICSPCTGGADGNGIYSGSGTIPGATEATLEPNGSFDIHYDGGIGAFVVSDGTGSAAIQNKAGTATVTADSTGVIIIADDMLSIEAEGSAGTLGQVLTRGASGAIWQDATGGGASVTEITYADMQTAITNSTLTPGGWYLITDATGTDLGFLTNAVNENTINVQGVGGYLNADFQAAGTYTGTPETFGTQLGIWRTAFEEITIPYTNLSGGTFAVGNTITGGTTGATAVIVTDDGANSMTVYMTSAGVAFNNSELLDNGAGVTADMDGAASSPSIVQGDVVIWNFLHYMLTDDRFLNGSNPNDNSGSSPAYIYYYDQSGAFQVGETITGGNGSTAVVVADDEDGTLEVSDITGDWSAESNFSGNTSASTAAFNGYDEAYNAAYTELAKTDPNQGYIERWYISEFDFENNWRAHIADNLGNKLSIPYGVGFYGSNGRDIHLGRDWVGNVIVNSELTNCKNLLGLFNFNTLTNRSFINNLQIFGGQFFQNTLSGAVILNLKIDYGNFGSNTLYQAVGLADITLIGGTTFTNNIFENGMNAFSILLQTSSDFSNNKFYQFSEISGIIASMPNVYIKDNNVFQNAVIRNISIAGAFSMRGNIVELSAQVTDISAGDQSQLSGQKIESFCVLSGITLSDRVQVKNNTILNGVAISNKTFASDVLFRGNTIGVSMTETETITDNIEGKRAIPGFSDIPATIDITGITTLDCTAAFAQYRGIYNLASTEINGEAAYTTSSGLLTPGETFTTDLGTTGTVVTDDGATVTVSNISQVLVAGEVITGDTSTNTVTVDSFTQTNATEAIDTITNPPTAFPFTIRPAAGLTLTVIGTAYAGIAAGQIALKATDYTLDGDKGEYIVLEIDPLGTGALIEKQVVNGLL